MTRNLSYRDPSREVVLRVEAIVEKEARVSGQRQRTSVQRYCAKQLMLHHAQQIEGFLRLGAIVMQVVIFIGRLVVIVGLAVLLASFGLKLSKVSLLLPYTLGLQGDCQIEMCCQVDAVAL